MAAWGTTMLIHATRLGSRLLRQLTKLSNIKRHHHFSPMTARRCTKITRVCLLGEAGGTETTPTCKRSNRHGAQRWNYIGFYRPDNPRRYQWYGARTCEQDTPLSVPLSTRRGRIRRYRPDEGRRTPRCSPQAQAHRPPQQQRRRHFRRRQECPPAHRSRCMAQNKKGVNIRVGVKCSTTTSLAAGRQSVKFEPIAWRTDAECIHMAF